MNLGKEYKTILKEDKRIYVPKSPEERYLDDHNLLTKFVRQVGRDLTREAKKHKKAAACSQLASEDPWYRIEGSEEFLSEVNGAVYESLERMRFEEKISFYTAIFSTGAITDSLIEFLMNADYCQDLVNIGIFYGFCILYAGSCIENFLDKRQIRGLIQLKDYFDKIEQTEQNLG